MRTSRRTPEGAARSRKRDLFLAGVGVVVAAAGLFVLFAPGRTDRADDPQVSPRRDDTLDPIKRGCELDPEYLLRIWRGEYGRRSPDLMMVPRYPNSVGDFDLPGHTGPWWYLQNVPLLFYGPDRIPATGRVEGLVGLVDVYPTLGRLLGVSLPPREGEVLQEVVEGANSEAPKLVVTIVWDGVGRNVLERWPHRWPHLARLEREGVSYVDASVGSNPSITPATHATLGTGVFPREHGVPAIVYRRGGALQEAFSDRDPSDLELTTVGDEVDLRLDNEPLVGMLAWKSWHLGMLGHGTATPGGDADHLALIGGSGGDIIGNEPLYRTPDYLDDFPSLDQHAGDVDLLDGIADGKWRGHPVLEEHDNPTWIRFQTDLLLAMLAREGYGSDTVPDLFFTNFKITDIVGHQYTMDSPEMGEVLEAQDEALGTLITYLDEEVGDYVVIVTADHGHTPIYKRTGGWAIGNGKVEDDVNRHFGIPQDESLFDATLASGYFLNRKVMKEFGITPEEVARYLNGYTIRDNWDSSSPELFRARWEEQVFAAVFTRRQLPDILECAFGAPRPPANLEA